MGRCAGIVHQENHYERIGDERFCAARRDIARAILKGNGKTEDGWDDNYANPDCIPFRR